MSDWLHWIGREYYTQKSFIKEAEKYGVTRRVSLQMAKQMSWGDQVFCAMLNGKKGEIFGYFTISKISGLSGEVVQKISEETKVTMTDTGGERIVRACGEYVTGPGLQTGASIAKIIKITEEVKKENGVVGKPMIGGIFTTIKPIKLMDIPFRQGFRTIDADKLFQQAQANEHKVHGQFYIDNQAKKTPQQPDHYSSGTIQTVESYQKKVIKDKAMLQLLLF